MVGSSLVLCIRRPFLMDGERGGVARQQELWRPRSCAAPWAHAQDWRRSIVVRANCMHRCLLIARRRVNEARMPGSSHTAQGGGSHLERCGAADPFGGRACVVDRVIRDECVRQSLISSARGWAVCASWPNDFRPTRCCSRSIERRGRSGIALHGHPDVLVAASVSTSQADRSGIAFTFALL